MDVKECVVCGAAFERPLGVRQSVWNRRICCSRTCGSRLPRKDRYDSPETKPCEVCGNVFARPDTYRGAQWEARRYCSRACAGRARTASAWDARPAKVCPVCNVEFRVAPSGADVLVTCGAPACKETYRRTIVAEAVSQTARANYASGKRRPGKGRSQREKDLWPALREAGWSWGMKWTDAWGTFELDFSLPERKLNVEIDGEEHAWTKRRTLDAARDAELERRGWRILRLPNEDVDEDPDAVVARVLAWAR